jgi:opacity protein-like surface antigen
MAGVFATSANAQSTKANAWEGAYGQVSVGYGMLSPSIGDGTASVPKNVIYPGSPANTATTQAANVNNISTGLASIAGGYNFGITKDYVLGIGAQFSPGASSSATGQLNTIAQPGIPGVPAGTKLDTQNATYNIKNLYAITLSPGYVIDKDRLAYFKVGYTGVTVGISTQNIPYNTVNLTGYTLGVGYKQMITDSLYLLGEINYASYGQKTANVTAYGVIPISQPVKASGTDLLVGVGYRF